ncbi:PLDc_N domain-containing protein [Actinomyces sp. 2119]|nr:PLDc_N domain-containing protein [Actinomyces sp. 2119]
MRAALFVLAFALQLYALLDCARTPEENMPARMPKFMWVVLIILVPTVGAIAWIIVSRVSAAERRGGYVEPTVWSSREGTSLRRPERPRPLAPDDDTDFLRDLEQDLRRRRHHPDTTTQGRRVPGTSDTQSTWDASGQAGTGRTAPGSAGASEHPQDPGRAQAPDGSAPADPGAPGSEEKRGGMADRKGQKEGQNPPEDPSPSDPDGTAGPSGGPDSGSAPCKP